MISNLDIFSHCLWCVKGRIAKSIDNTHISAYNLNPCVENKDS